MPVNYPLAGYIAYQLKPNGNTPVERGRQRRFITGRRCVPEWRTFMDHTSIPRAAGKLIIATILPASVLNAQPLQVATRRTHGAFTTRTGMCGNGVRIGGHRVCRAGVSPIRRDLRRARTVLSAAAVWEVTRAVADLRPVASAIRPRDTTPLVSALSSSRQFLNGDKRLKHRR